MRNLTSQCSSADHGRPELLFVLQQEVAMYDTYQQRIAECDQQLQEHLTSFANIIPLQPTEEEPKREKNKTRQECPAIRAPQRIAAYFRSRSDEDRRHRSDGSPDFDQ
jgi:hypothetical protein